MSCDCLEHLPDKTAGGPVCHRDNSTGSANAREFGRNTLRTWSKHRSDQTDDGIELSVFIRKRLGVSFFKHDLQPFSRSSGAPFFEPVRGDIARRNMRAIPCGDKSKLPGASPNVEQPNSR